MHRIIRFIVNAGDKKEALDAAHNCLNEAIEDNSTGIDYGTFFNDTKSTMSGQARWGKRPVACKLLSKEGKELLLSGVMADWCNFKYSYEEVKKIMEHSAHSVYHEQSRFYFWGMHQNEFVYFEESGFRDMNELNGCFKHGEPDELWIVPCDVHF